MKKKKMTFKVELADFDLSGLPDVLEAANKRVAENERRRFSDTVNNWKRKPSFTRVITKSYFGVNDFEIVTDSKVFLWVDRGTEEHEITPNGDYALKIRGGGAYKVGEKSYEPKTSPDRLKSSGSGKYYPKNAYMDSVYQKIEPRNFTEKIKEKAPERWERAIDTEIKNYLNKKVR